MKKENPKNLVGTVTVNFGFLVFLVYYNLRCFQSDSYILCRPAKKRKLYYTLPQKIPARKKAKVILYAAPEKTRHFYRLADSGFCLKRQVGRRTRTQYNIDGRLTATILLVNRKLYLPDSF